MQTSLFVWRDHWDDERPIPPSSFRSRQCYWCGTSLRSFARQERVIRGVDSHDAHEYGDRCLLCGWQVTHGYLDYGLGEGSSLGPAEPWWSMRVLREFPLNSTRLEFSEVASYLKRNRQALFDLSWRRFEELIADALSVEGLRVILTQPSRDGGADILVLSDQSGDVVRIIECKKWTSERKVGVKEVRSLVGAAVDWHVRSATLVTTSDYSRDAVQLATSYRDSGFQIDLNAATDVLRLLGCYQAHLPTLDRLSEDDRRTLLRNAELILGDEVDQGS